MVNQNTGRGLLLAAVALLFLVQAPRYTIGSLSRPGPGLFPVIVAGVLLVIGIVIVVRSHFIAAEPLDFRAPQHRAHRCEPSSVSRSFPST